MGLRRVQVILLCEDAAQERFLRRFLKERGHDGRRSRTIMSPSARGAGEQFVREHYAAEVRAHRQNHNRVAEALIVMVDADVNATEGRRRNLEAALKEAGQPGRDHDERIVVLIPRRNVETWVAHLNGHAVDETTDYKPRPIAEFRSAAERLRAHCGSARANCCPPSLLEGCAELQRLDQR